MNMLLSFLLKEMAVLLMACGHCLRKLLPLAGDDKGPLNIAWDLSSYRRVTRAEDPSVYWGIHSSLQFLCCKKSSVPWPL